jgi:hypothetical protein
MIRRRVIDAGVFAPVCCHSFRATGITVGKPPAPVFKPRSAPKSPPRSAQQDTSPPEKLQVTSLRQAYDILGLPPGRTTLAAAKAAYRARIHPIIHITSVRPGVVTDP